MKGHRVNTTLSFGFPGESLTPEYPLKQGRAENILMDTVITKLQPLDFYQFKNGLSMWLSFNQLPPYNASQYTILFSIIRKQYLRRQSSRFKVQVKLMVMYC